MNNIIDNIDHIDFYNLKLWNWLESCINNQELELSEDDIRDCLENELEISIDYMDADLKLALPYIFKHYIETWSGWQYVSLYRKHNISDRSYFKTFYKYLSIKMKSSFCDALFKYKKDKPTLLVPNNPYFPFKIVINCPPRLMNTMVFFDSQNDITISQHMGKSWTYLSDEELLSWPNIGVAFRSKDLSFVRKQLIDYTRYLNIYASEFKSYNNDIVENCVYLKPEYGRSPPVYTNRLLEAYIKCFKNSIEAHKGIMQSKKTEIAAILDLFVKDIKRINVNDTIPAFVNILFKQTTEPFIRNIKIMQDKNLESLDERVGYCETLIPKVELCLNQEFTGIQIDDCPVKFQFPESMARIGDVHKIVPEITYTCIYCNIHFQAVNSKDYIVSHLKIHHRMEQPVRCMKCKVPYEIQKLSAKNWEHSCST